MNDLAYMGLIILALPVVAFAVLALFHNRLPRHGDWLGTGAMFIALCLAVRIFVVVAGGGHDYNAEPARLACEWLTLDHGGPGTMPSGAVLIGIQIDNLTSIMLVVVTLISFLVQLFSMGYMHGDSKYGRFYASLSMFTASMLGLVLSDNLLTLYISWEIMGLASYVLIGHFLHKPSANNACMKAFITTRIGDVGMFLGILVLYWQVGSFRFDDIFAAVNAGTLSDSLRYWCALGLFFGAMGKSAQFPLHVWLPDAMEGPTPVSCLIHAATMVAAGVYLVGRMYILFPMEALVVVAWIGAITAVMAATIAIVQTDIKKVLAYSTVSQLGYMMIGLGCYGYAAGLGHLTTHAFFKGCLFLGSGSIIHAMHHHQEMSDYGGLWKKMPITFATFLIVTLALTGCPYLFSGFWTKDAVIAKAIEFGSVMGGAHTALGWMASGAALLTSFYMFRLIFLTFFGKPKNHHLYEHAHESPWTMTAPLVILATLSFWYVGGPVGLFGGRNVLSDMLSMPPVKQKEIHLHLLQALETHGGSHAQAGDQSLDGIRFAQAGHGASHANPNAQHPTSNAQHPTGNSKLPTPNSSAHDASPAAHGAESHLAHIEHSAHIRAVTGSFIVFPLGVFIAMVFYLFGWLNPARWAEALRPAYIFLRELWYIDHFYRVTVIRPFLFLCRFSGGFDKYVIDGVVWMVTWITRFKAWFIGLFDNLAIDGAYNGGAWGTRWMGRLAASAQTGKVRTYLLTIAVSAVILAFVFALTRSLIAANQ